MMNATVLDFQQQQANHKFRSYVQRIAFSLTLTDHMIRGLLMVKDYPGHKPSATREDRIEFHKKQNCEPPALFKIKIYL